MLLFRLLLGVLNVIIVFTLFLCLLSDVVLLFSWLMGSTLETEYVLQVLVAQVVLLICLFVVRLLRPSVSYSNRGYNSYGGGSGSTTPIFFGDGDSGSGGCDGGGGGCDG